MADDTPPPNEKERRLVTALSILLFTCVVATVALAAWSSIRPPAEWDMVNKVLDHLATLDLLFSGALVNATKPSH